MAVPEEAAAAAAALGPKGLVAVTRMAHDADRHSDMFALVNKLAKMNTEFNEEARKFFVISYRYNLSAKLRALASVNAMKERQDDPEQAKYTMFYHEALERDIQAMCWETLDIVDKHLLPFSHAAENIILCNNTKADACCFLAMLKVEENNKQLHVEKALTAYEDASKEAVRLPAEHVLRHALHFTKTALFYDVKELPEMATALAKLASFNEESCKKIAEIIGIKEENLKLWETISPNSKENNISSKLASLSLKEEPSYSGGSPSPPPPPVVPRPAGPPVAPNEFVSPGDWGYEVHEGLTPREIRFRKKKAQKERGSMNGN